MYSRGQYRKVYAKMRGPRPKLLVFVLVLCSTGVRPDEDLFQDERTVNLPASDRAGQGGAIPTLHRSKRAQPKDSTSVCTSDLFQQLSRCEAFSAAVNYELGERYRKNQECIGRLGKNAYYDTDLHTCGNCSKTNCLQNYFCKRECADKLAQQSYEERMDATSEELSDLKNRAGEWVQGVDQNMSAIRDEIAKQLSQRDDQLEEEAKKNKALTASVTELEKEITRLRGDNQEIFWWCVILSVFIAIIIISLVIAAVVVGCLYVKRPRSKYSVEETGSSLLSPGPSVSSSQQISREGAMVDLSANAPASLTTNLVLGIDNRQDAPR